MRAFVTTATVAMLSLATADAGVIWDNYQGPSGYDGMSARSSERETIVSASYTADDAVFETPVELEGIKWIGMRDPEASYQAADVIVLDSAFNVVLEHLNVPYSATPIGTDFGMQTYEGALNLPAVQVLDPGQYYYATRLVNLDLGRNFVATTGEGNIQGMTEGAFISSWFGINDWTLVGDLTRQTDYAYQLIGTVVPEPASLALLALAGLALYRRR